MLYAFHRVCEEDPNNEQMIEQKFRWKSFYGALHWRLNIYYNIIMDDVLTWVSEFKLNPNEQSSASCDGMPMLMRGNIGTMTIALFINKLMETYNNASTVGKLGTWCIPPITHFQFYFQNIHDTRFYDCEITLEK